MFIDGVDITQPYKTIQTHFGGISVYPRNSYCDRGEFQLMLNMDFPPHTFMSVINNQYYFDIRVLQNEVVSFEALAKAQEPVRYSSKPIVDRFLTRRTDKCIFQAFRTSEPIKNLWQLEVHPTVGEDSGFNIDSSDGFPRYYLAEESLRIECDRWIAERKQITDFLDWEEIYLVL